MSGSLPRGQVHDVVRAARVDRPVRLLVDPAARRRLGCRARPSAERPGVLRRRGGRARSGERGRGARRAVAVGHRLRPGHRRQLCPQFSSGDQATGVRRHHARRFRGQCGGREADARVDVAARLHRGHHELLREASAELPAVERTGTVTLDYKAIDVDNHYYEPLDALTRHLPREFKRRGVQMVQNGKRTWAVMGERVNHFIPNPTFDPIIEPGCLDLLFRGEIPEGVDPASLMKVDRLADHPEYQNRDARVKVMDTQGIETVFMLPTFACGVEEALKHDVDATTASVHAFNLWLDEDWGFDRPDHRIIAAPIISLADPAKAVDEIEYALEHGAKLVLVRPAPVPGVVKPRSLGDSLHDPVWARLAEAGVPVGFHLSDSGYLAIAALWGGKGTFEGFGKKDPLDQILLDDRAI